MQSPAKFHSRPNVSTLHQGLFKVTTRLLTYSRGDVICQQDVDTFVAITSVISIQSMMIHINMPRFRGTSLTIAIVSGNNFRISPRNHVVRICQS